MRLGKFLKTPNEIKRYTIEYAHWLDDGEFLSAISFNIVSESEGLLVFVPNTIAPSSTKVSFFVTGGTDNQTYRAAVSATTTAGQVKQDTIDFIVRAP